MSRYLFVHLLVFLAGTSYGQSPSSEALQLKKVLLQYHIEPRAIDDQFSRDVFGLLIEKLDPQKIFFTQPEIDELRKFELQIDNELNGDKWTFFPLLSATFKASLQRADKISNIICLKPFEFKQNFSIDTVFAKDNESLTIKWRNVLMSECIIDLLQSKERYPTLTEAAHLQQHEPTGRAKVKLKYGRIINRFLDHPMGFESFMSSFFLRSISMAFDPHSVYLSRTEMQNFISSLSTEGFHFGFDLASNEDDEVIIDGLFPGGPAWKSGEISNGDIVQKIRWEGGEWIELVGMDEWEIEGLLAQTNSSFIELVLRKNGGIEKTVRLKKEKIGSDEEVVRSFLLHGKRRIGYISLPGFYSSWGEKEGARAANDVAKEILKLKKDNIEGIILDLRNNGGGSLDEAVAMAGIFVDAGPIGILKSKNEEAITLKDMNRGTVYDGPLIIMVNGRSASASEFLAAALQDYHRALIVGEKTYGKAIGQLMYSLEPGKPTVDYKTLEAPKGWGYSTVTTSRIYRINGRTIQKSGVNPDIVLTGLSQIYSQRESNTPFALQPDSIAKKTYAQVLPLLSVPELKEKSKSRVQKNDKFIATERFNDSLKKQISYESEILSWQDLKKIISTLQQEKKAYEQAASRKTELFDVSPNSFSKARLQVDGYAVDSNAAWIDNLSRDVSLEEAFLIMCDYVETITRN